MKNDGATRGSMTLPIGRNCHLGIALAKFGHHESSLFRWADLPLRSLRAFLDGAEPFTGRTEFRITGTTFGTLSHAALPPRLAEAPPEAMVNTVVYDTDGHAYVHGVQLTPRAAAELPYAEICDANAQKVAFLREKWRLDLSAAASVLLIRLEWEPVIDIEPYVSMAQSLRVVNPAAELKVASPVGAVEGMREGITFVALRSPLPPPSDVMNVSATQAEWRELFATWGVVPTGAAKRYLFDV